MAESNPEKAQAIVAEVEMEKKLPPRRRMSQLDMAEDLAAAAAAATASVTVSGPSESSVEVTTSAATETPVVTTSIPFKSPFESVEEKEPSKPMQSDAGISDRIYTLLLKNVSRDEKMTPPEMKVRVNEEYWCILYDKWIVILMNGL